MPCLSDELFDTENEECNSTGFLPIGEKMKVENCIMKMFVLLRKGKMTDNGKSGIMNIFSFLIRE